MASKSPDVEYVALPSVESHPPSGSPPSVEQDTADMATDDFVIKSERRNGDTLAGFTALGAALLIALTSIILVVISDPANLSWFIFHAPFNTIALLVFVIAIVQLQPTSQPRTKAIGLERHQLGAFIAFPLLLAGTFAVFYNKVIRSADHFKTWHGTFGIITVAYLVVQGAFGASTVWFGGAAFGGGIKAKLMWKYHRLSGYIVLLLLLITVNLGGAWSSWVNNHTVYPVRLFVFTIAPIALFLAVLSRVRPSKMKFS